MFESFRLSKERGFTESVQWALLVPVIVLLFFGVLNASLYLHAQTVINQAVQAGAESQMLFGNTEGAAEQSVLQVAAGGGLTEVTVQTVSDDSRVIVTAKAKADLPLPGDVWVEAEASMPKEHT